MLRTEEDWMFRVNVCPAVEFSSKIPCTLQLEFSSLPEARAASEAISQVLLFIQDDLELVEDYSNYCIIEQFNEEEDLWEMVEDCSDIPNL